MCVCVYDRALPCAISYAIACLMGGRISSAFVYTGNSVGNAYASPTTHAWPAELERRLGGR